MADLRAVSFHWLAWRPEPNARSVRRAARPLLGVPCPHCTNLDTLSPHCANPACRWAQCTCGALVYDRRRHRHPRHGSDHDTCHAPRAAA